MLERLFQPLHVLILFWLVPGFLMPFLAGFFLGRYLELKKLKKP